VSAATGGRSCVEVARAFLAAVERDELNAWAAVDAETLLAAAAGLDRLGAPERERLALFGLPIGVKDNFDTADLPTSYGSPIYAGCRPARDADAVRRLRHAGALVVGKTKLAEFAWMHPSDTLNPVDRTRSPGGSSSGSAAAVGAGVVPVATGTQTAGSVIRPAAYCGIVGYKPTFGLISRDGIKPLADSLDTVGLLGRGVREVALVASVLAGSSLDLQTLRGGRPLLAFARTPLWDRVERPSQRAIERALSVMRGVEEVELPPGFTELVAAQTTIQSYEGAVALEHEFRSQSGLLSDELRAAIVAGRALPRERYEAARGARDRHAAPLIELLGRYDGVLTPSTTGVPPAGLSFTGDPLFCRVWTLIGAPSVSLPLAWTDDGLPAGLQLIGRPGNDARTLAAAATILDR
jgi:Asp-tRNA(Asn)/Glu-tRNA(Gln) amidotransferase A subunit family amidase